MGRQHASLAVICLSDPLPKPDSLLLVRQVRTAHFLVCLYVILESLHRVCEYFIRVFRSYLLSVQLETVLPYVVKKRCALLVLVSLRVCQLKPVPDAEVGLTCVRVP